MDPQAKILYYLLFVPHMLFALSIHEASHAGSAYLLGDDTAALQGRLTLNPLKHLDPWGLLAFFLIHWGWAKPVPVNPLRLRHLWRDDMIVSFAGPASNLLVGLVLLVLIRVAWIVMGVESEEARTALAFLMIGAELNIGLAIFNLIPVPPLDGSHILIHILPRSLARRLEPYLAYGPIILAILVLGTSFLPVPVFSFIIGIPMTLLIHTVLGGQIFMDVNAIMASLGF